MTKKEESLISILNSNFFNFDECYVEEKSIMKNLKLEGKDRFKTDEIIAVIDSSIEVDGSFMSFCKENNYTVENLQIFSLVNLNERGLEDYDPYIACGYFSIKKDDFEFLKLSKSPNGFDEMNNIWSFVILPSKDYDKYIELKTNYYNWQKEKNGIIVSVVGGEDFAISGNNKIDNLFFGEHKDLKNDIFDNIKFFMDNEDFYKKNNLPWVYSIFIEGESGSGKTEFVNTIVSNYDVAPVTINQYNCDDSVIELVFNISKTVKRSCIILENIDDLIDQELVSVSSIVNLMNKCSYNNGILLIITSRESIPDINKVSFRFDKFIKLQSPDYKESLNNLFGEFLGTRQLSLLKKSIMNNKLNYGHLKQIRDLYIKSNINELKEDPEKLKKKAFKKINSILQNISKEVKINTNTKTGTKIGLLKGRD